MVTVVIITDVLTTTFACLIYTFVPL